MFFVVSRAEFIKRMDVVRNDRSRKKRKALADESPYLRLAATDDNRVTLSGLSAEVEFGATVYEPGVLFLRAAKFRLALQMLPDSPTVAIQANSEQLAFGDTRFPVEGGDFLLYPNPAQAPKLHPGDRMRAREAVESKLNEAKQRLEQAKDRLLLAATEVVEAQRSVAALLGDPEGTRRVLMELVEASLGAHKKAPRKKR